MCRRLSAERSGCMMHRCPGCAELVTKYALCYICTQEQISDAAKPRCSKGHICELLPSRRWACSKCFCYAEDIKGERSVNAELDSFLSALREKCSDRFLLRLYDAVESTFGLEREDIITSFDSYFTSAELEQARACLNATSLVLAVICAVAGKDMRKYCLAYFREHTPTMTKGDAEKIARLEMEKILK